MEKLLHSEHNETVEQVAQRACAIKTRWNKALSSPICPPWLILLHARGWTRDLLRYLPTELSWDVMNSSQFT